MPCKGHCRRYRDQHGRAMQWRNVISGGPRFKLFEGHPSRSAKGTSRAPYMHEFSSGSRVSCSPGKFLNLDSLKCHFLDFEERFYRILMVRKWHCCSIGYRLSLGPPLGLGAPGFSRSEPIVVTPLPPWPLLSWSLGNECKPVQTLY